MYGFNTRVKELEQGPVVIEEKGPSESSEEEDSSFVTPMWNIK